MNYEEALSKLRHPSSGNLAKKRKLANNTYLEPRRNDDIAIRLHATDVATLHPDGSVTFNSGGWYTPTTKDRMNMISGVCIFSDRGSWRLGFSSGPYGWREAHDTGIPYVDGIRVHPGRREVLTDDETLDTVAEMEDSRRDMAKRIKAYVDELATPEVLRRLASEAREGTYNGDCWYCLMRNEEGIPLGDASDDHSHLEAHLDEHYFMVSLVLNAAGDHFRRPSAVFGMWLHDMERGYAPRMLKETVTKYLKARLYEGPHAANRQAAVRVGMDKARHGMDR